MTAARGVAVERATGVTPRRGVAAGDPAETTPPVGVALGCGPVTLEPQPISRSASNRHSARMRVLYCRNDGAAPARTKERGWHLLLTIPSQSSGAPPSGSSGDVAHLDDAIGAYALRRRRSALPASGQIASSTSASAGEADEADALPQGWPLSVKLVGAGLLPL